MIAAALLMGAAGATAAITRPLLGLPEAFRYLLASAVVMWVAGLVAASLCVAPWRPAAARWALGGAAMAWPTIFLFDLAPLWGLVAMACAAVLVRTSRSSPTRSN